MKSINPNQPFFQIYVKDQWVATMFDPRFDDMFWCSYRVEAANDEGDAIIHDSKIWEHVTFVVKDMKGRLPNPHTFSGGFTEFCARETDRLSFHSLSPPRPPCPSVALRIIAAAVASFGDNQSKKRDVAEQ